MMRIAKEVEAVLKRVVGAQASWMALPLNLGRIPISTIASAAKAANRKKCERWVECECSQCSDCSTRMPVSSKCASAERVIALLIRATVGAVFVCATESMRFIVAGESPTRRVPKKVFEPAERQELVNAHVNNERLHQGPYCTGAVASGGTRPS